jgi:hypothetical protein
MTKCIFLDIDGVLNTEVWVRHIFSLFKGKTHGQLKKYLRDDYGATFDSMAVDMLSYIINETDAKIVISSTWRASGLKIMLEMWKTRELPGEVIDITPNHMSWTGSTLQRGKEIDEWLSKHPEVTNYVIIDDDTDMEPHQLGNFVHVDPQYGLTAKKALECINILNN